MLSYPLFGSSYKHPFNVTDQLVLVHGDGNLTETLEIVIPDDMTRKIDDIMKIIGFDRREDFAEAAIRRAVDMYMVIICRALESN